MSRPFQNKAASQTIPALELSRDRSLAWGTIKCYPVFKEAPKPVRRGAAVVFVKISNE